MSTARSMPAVGKFLDHHLTRALMLTVKLGGVPPDAAIVPLGLMHTKRTAGSYAPAGVYVHAEKLPGGVAEFE